MSHTAERSIDIDVPVEKFYELITDFERYPEFLSDVLDARILSREEESYRVEFTVRVIRKVEYTLVLTGVPSERLTWTLGKPGLFKSNEGGWWLESLGDTKTRATYRLAVSVSAFVPKAITKRLVSFTLPEMLQQWKGQAERLYSSTSDQ
jgi:ribosome-associated toxin RatA of RatAB toxin-antitoxin module